MKIEVRHIVAAVLLLFAWKGSELDLSWPPAPNTTIAAPTPAKEFRQWADPVKALVPKMLPADRIYLAHLYDAMAFVLLRDRDRETPIIGTTEAFANFHGGTLDLAIDKAKVGRYPGLAEAIDQTFLTAVGTDEPRALTADEKQRLIVACGVLSYTFGIGRDG